MSLLDERADTGKRVSIPLPFAAPWPCIYSITSSIAVLFALEDRITTPDAAEHILATIFAEVNSAR